MGVYSQAVVTVGVERKRERARQKEESLEGMWGGGGGAANEDGVCVTLVTHAVTCCSFYHTTCTVDQWKEREREKGEKKVMKVCVGVGGGQ